MTKKTWPYGTARRAVVKSVVAAADTLMLLDETGEGHILVGTKGPAEEGDAGQLIFTEGGPTGGYWRFVRSPPELAP